MAASDQIVTVADVRRTVGITEDQIEDDDISRIITESISAVEKYLNTSILPITIIDTPDLLLGTDSNAIFVNKHPILNILAVKINTTTVSPQYVHFYPGGKLILDADAEETVWDDTELQSNVIKYTYGMIEDGPNQTTTVNNITSPADNTSIRLNDATGFKADQWIRIYGMDGKNEIIQIETVSGNSITADLKYPHEYGSLVVIQDVPQNLRRFVQIIASLMLVARIVGESATDIVGYELEGFRVQKGEPYTQWRETYQQLNAERVELLKSIRPKSATR